MKITLEISDLLIKAAKSAARRQGTTLGALVEHGLRLALDGQPNRPPFTLRDASFSGEGLQPDASATAFAALRRLSYGDRGG